MIGDNLGSYFNATIIQAHREKNIKFTPFPAIGCCCFDTFEESMEVIVRGVAEGIKEQRNLPKEHFPLPYNGLVGGTKDEIIVTGFKAT